MILLWLGRGDVEREEKEAFIEELVEFEDGCEDFYGYRAYFLAAIGIVEFKECALTDEIIREIVKWSFGEFDINRQEWTRFLNPIEEAARDTLSLTIRDQVINEISDLLENCPNEDTQMEVAEILGEIAVGNEEASATLTTLLADFADEYTRMEAAEILGEIAVGNEEVSAALIKFLTDSADEDIRLQAAEILGEIAVGNEEASAALITLLADSADEDTRLQAAYSLGKINPGNEKAIATLITLLADSADEDTRLQAAQSLAIIDPGNEKAIAALINLLANSADILTRLIIANTLEEIAVEEIAVGNEEVTDALISLLADFTNEDIRLQVAYSLGRIDPGNEKAIATLITLLADSNDENTRWQAAGSLGRIDPGNEKAIATLITLLADSNDKNTRWQAANSLKEIIVTYKQYARVVSTLKPYLADEVYNNDFDRFKHCFDIIWHCAQNLPYPDFHQAWHNPPITPHPEVQETTGVGITPTTLNLNLENLPANLTKAIQTYSDLVDQIQFVCFDASQFIDADNPALEIYAELISQGYLERPNGEPETLQALKVYRQLNCPKVFLIFYEVPSNPPPQGLSSVFLTALSKFTNANRIAVISDAGEIPLQCFSPSQGDLIQSIVRWMRGIVLES